ncbi:hypothetical protein FQR65_LT15348 [Abscondita terminalis]|nr:hypothetical protein FQR65_LT15348 [Abscondita terminalis]
MGLMGVTLIAPTLTVVACGTSGDPEEDHQVLANTNATPLASDPYGRIFGDIFEVTNDSYGKDNPYIGKHNDDFTEFTYKVRNVNSTNANTSQRAVIASRVLQNPIVRKFIASNLERTRFVSYYSSAYDNGANVSKMLRNTYTPDFIESNGKDYVEFLTDALQENEKFSSVQDGDLVDGKDFFYGNEEFAGGALSDQIASINAYFESDSKIKSYLASNNKIQIQFPLNPNHQSTLNPKLLDMFAAFNSISGNKIEIVSTPNIATVNDYQDITNGGVVFSSSVGQPGSQVTDVFANAIPYSFAFGAVGITITYVLGIPLGIYAAKNKGKVGDGAINGVAVLITSIPPVVFVSSIYLLTVFVFGAHGTFLSGTLDTKLLPVLVIVLMQIPMVIINTRRYVVDEMTADYTKFAASKVIALSIIVPIGQIARPIEPEFAMAGPSADHLFGIEVTDLVEMHKVLIAKDNRRQIVKQYKRSLKQLNKELDSINSLKVEEISNQISEKENTLSEMKNKMGFGGNNKLIYKIDSVNEKLENLKEHLELASNETFRNKKTKNIDNKIQSDLMNIKKIKKIQKLRGATIATVFQDPMTSLNPLLSVGFQISEVLRKHRKMTRSEAKLEAIKLLEKVGIKNAEKRYKEIPGKYSGGMRQRVVIAIALACQPKVLICDEPTTALDVTIQAQILKLLKDLQEEYKFATVFITHDLGVVANIADRVAVMYAGQIIEYGNTEEIFYNAQHPYT